MSKTRNQTTKEDIIRLIKVYPTVQSKKELADKLDKDEHWLIRMIPLVRKAGVDLPKFKNTRAKLVDLIKEAMAELK